MDIIDKLFYFFIVAIIVVVNFYWLQKYSKFPIKFGTPRCPNCNKSEAKKTKERILGIFNKGTYVRDHSRRGSFKWVVIPHEKIETRYQCNFCGYEWAVSDARKLQMRLERNRVSVPCTEATVNQTWQVS